MIQGEDLTAFICMLEEKSGFCLGIRPVTKKNKIHAVFDETLFGSFSRGPAAEWFDLFVAALTQDKIITQPIARFADGKMQYRF